jgi:MarR family transcriptional regulator, organic hydroperoxide resistance regulator
MQKAGFIERIRDFADERLVFVELTECGKSVEDRASCLGRAVFGDIGIPVERIFRLTDEVKALRDALNAKLAGRGR